MREMTERLRVISRCPVKVFVASYVPRYWYPYRLQHAGAAKDWVKDESLEVILDSGISDEDIGNRETLDRAHEVGADFVIPADTLHDQTATTAAVREFGDLCQDHPCTATPLIPLQPPYDEHYRELDGYSHYVLGGIARADPERQLEALRTFRDEAGPHPYAHGLGLGASLTLIRALRDEPGLLDSLDLSTPEQVVRGEKLPDKTWIQKEHQFPTGEDSSTVRAAFASAVALQLNYMLSPMCSDDLLKSEWQQSTLATGVSRGD